MDCGTSSAAEWKSGRNLVTLGLAAKDIEIQLRKFLLRERRR